MTAAATDTFGVFPFVCVAILLICCVVQQISEAYQVSFRHPNCCFPPADGSVAASLHCWSCPGYFYLFFCCVRELSHLKTSSSLSLNHLFLRLLIQSFEKHHRVLERCLILERCIDKALQWRQSGLNPSWRAISWIFFNGFLFEWDCKSWFFIW